MCVGETYFVSFGVETLHVVILQLHAQWVVEVKKSFACFANFERNADNVSGLYSIEELIVMLCCCFLKSAVSNFLRALCFFHPIPRSLELFVQIQK